MAKCQMAFVWLRLNIWSHSWSLLYCIFISNDQRRILKKCDCNNQSLGHIPGCSLHIIDQTRHTKAHCSVVAATGTQAWWTSGDVLAGVTYSDSTDRALGPGDYRCTTAGPRHSRSHCCQVLSSPLALLWPWERLRDETLGSSPFTPAFRMPIRQRPNQLLDNTC